MRLRTSLFVAAVGTVFVTGLASLLSWPLVGPPPGGVPTAMAYTPPPATPDDPIPALCNFGYDPDRQGIEDFLQSLDRPTLRAAAPHLFETRTGKTVLLYPAYQEAYRQAYGREWVCGRQGIGDCVSWGWAHGCAFAHAISWKVGEVGTWHDVCTEAIYGGSRVEARGKPGDGKRPEGGYRDGSYGAAAAKWCKNWGVVYRLSYPASGHTVLDLTRYSKDRAKQWGAYGCGGSDPYWATELDRIAKQHPCRNVALVSTWDELVAAITNGYPVPVCSGQGFTRTRDKDGFARASGSWPHCMCFIGVRFDREGALCLNSWGPTWISGPKWPDGKDYDVNNPRGPPAQPDGSFWVDRATVERMLRGRDSFAVSDQLGWPARKLDHKRGW